MNKVTFGALLAMFVAIVPAAAQNREPGGLPPHDVVDIVRDGGFDPLSQPVRRGPNYVLRAVDEYDREVRVIINARSGDIVSVTPVATASRAPPGGSVGPYERVAPGYVPAPGPYRWGAPVIDEDDPAYRRPPEAVPNAPPRPDASARLQPSGPAAGSPVGPDEKAIEQRPLTAAAPPSAGDQQGLLPPPPERFPQRVAPAPPKPKPVKRAAAQTPPKSAPLPRPRPSTADTPPSPPMHSVPIPPPTPEPPTPPADDVPN